MRVSREQAAKNREHVIDTAARLFREKGYSGIGVADLMQEAGLTHGGFYGNFASKEALMGAACERAFEDTAGRWGDLIARDPDTALAGIVASYLSRKHVAHPGQGCVMAALGGDMARLSEPLKAVTAAGLRSQIDLLTPLMAGSSPDERRRAAMAAYAGMVGALVLARAVSDDALSDDILGAVQAGILAGR